MPLKKHSLNSSTILDLSEFQLLKDHALYVRKRLLSEKITGILSLCADETTILLNEYQLPKEVINNSPKISKGENYLGFPWHNLDYPRYFKREDVFAIRTLCWWGNSFIITLHLSGIFEEKYHAVVFKNLSQLKNNNFYYCINDQQWEHQISPTNYIQLDDCFADLLIHEKNAAKNKFIKIAKLFSLDEWNNFPELSKSTVKDFFNLLETSQ